MASGYRHFSLEERRFLVLCMLSGWSCRAMARQLQRAPSSVCRELDRNAHPKRGYWATGAQWRAEQRSKRPRRRRKLAQRRLWGQVERLLRKGWSPQQIAGRWKARWPNNPERWVSHETIYRALYVLPRGELRSSLLASLRQSHIVRRPRRRGKNRRGVIPNMVSIHDRPEEVEARQVPGHWEGDMLLGARHKTAVGSLVERTSRFLILAHMQHRDGAGALEAFTRKLNPVPRWLRKSLTYDRGKEMAAHEQLRLRLGIQVYFADPHSPWQRGTNENTNALVRQYLPKSTDLSVHSQRDLDKIARLINDRPRKCLGFKTPREVFREILNGVALEL